jgi:hypothetical protein
MGSSPHLDLSIRQYVLDLCRILYLEKTSYLVTLKLPKKKKRFTCHNLGKVNPALRDGFNEKGKIIMRWEYPDDRPPKWTVEPPPVITPMAPPPLKLKIKLKGLTGP